MSWIYLLQYVFLNVDQNFPQEISSDSGSVMLYMCNIGKFCLNGDFNSVLWLLDDHY